MTSRKHAALSPSEARWRSLRAIRIIALGGFVFALFVIPYAANTLHRDRASLRWPTVPGLMRQCDVWERSSRHSYSVGLNAAYSYTVNGVRHISHQLCLWSPDLSHANSARAFAQAHPVHSAVEVYYDPGNPANAVLVPGADELTGRIQMGAGIFVMPLAVFLFFRSRKEYARLAVQRPKDQTRPRPAAAKSDLSATPFLSYEPGSKRKLNCFPDKECLLDFLGHGGEKLRDWKSDDRVIDVSGRPYRLAESPDKKRYELEATGETWDWQKILALAVNDAALIKKDPIAIQRRVEQAPDTGKIHAIMQCVDELPAASFWFWVGFGLFLLLFFLAVFFAAGSLFLWLRK